MYGKLCHRCGEPLSTEATICPKCGSLQNKTKKKEDENKIQSNAR